MKIRILFLFCFCLLGISVLETQALNPESLFIEEKSDELPPDYDLIELSGNLVLNAGPNAVEAGFNETSVYIQFNQNLGYVSVTVINPYGLTIYTGVVNTAVQQLVVIPVSLSAEGIYTIVLDNTSEYAEGDFEILPYH